MARLALLFMTSLILSASNPVEAQDRLETGKVLEFFHAIYRYDFTAAEKLLKEVRLENPGQPGTLLCESNYYWWLMMTGMEDEKTIAQFESANRAVIDYYAGQAPTSLTPSGIFSIIHGYAYQTRYLLHHKKHIPGISNLSKILPYLRVALEQPEANEKFGFAAGLYHYLAAVTKEEHPVLRPFFTLAPDADKALGYRLLSEAAKSPDPLIQTEATYFLMKINLEIAHKPAEAIKWSKVLVQDYPDNILYHFYLLSAYVERGLKYNSQQEFETINRLSRSLPGLTSAQRKHFQKEGQEVLSTLQ